MTKGILKLMAAFILAVSPLITRGQQTLATNGKFFPLTGQKGVVDKKHKKDAESTINKLCFIENKGQVKDLDGNSMPDVLFTGKSNGVQYLLTKTGIAYIYTKCGKKSKTTLARVDMALTGCNTDPKITTAEQEKALYNYYVCNINGTLNVHGYGEVTYHDIYPDIDMKVYVKNNFLEYDFAVHPGGNPDLINMRFKGSKNVKIDRNGDLIVKNSLGVLKEYHPFTYQTDANKKLEIKSGFSLKNKTVSFSLNKYNKGKDIIIDPTRVWGTYFGGSNDDEINSIAFDEYNNLYVVGTTFSSGSIAYVGASGVYQSTFGGGTLQTDAFLAKFNDDGALQWATYYGGSNYDEGSGIAIDGNDYPVICGQTWSKGIATSGAYKTQLGSVYGSPLGSGPGSPIGGGYYGGEAFLAQFHTDGSMSWATYYGGTGYEELNTLWIDKSNSNQIYAVGETTDGSSIATTGAYQTSKAGDRDAFIIKFSDLGTGVYWGTYYGANNADELFGVVGDNSSSGYIYVCGASVSTTSSNIYCGSPGFGQNTGYGIGATDGIMAKFAKSGSGGTRGCIWGSYCGGAQIDGFGAATMDNVGNIYFVGSFQSTSNSSGPLKSSGGAAHSSGTNYDTYILKLTPSGTRIWARYFGGTDVDAAYGVTTDGLNTYMTGYTKSIISMSCAFQSSIDNGFTSSPDVGDAFIVEFDSTGSIIWDTYYGGSDYDYGNSIALDNNNAIFIAGYTQSGTSYYEYNPIYTSGAYQTSFGGNSSPTAYFPDGPSPLNWGDGFIEKFAQCNLGTCIVTPDANTCGWVNIVASDFPGLSYQWYTSPGNVAISGAQSSTYAAETTGNYYVVVTSGTGNCCTRTSHVVSVTVNPLPAASVAAGTAICYGYSYSVGASPVSGDTYSWSPSTGLTSSTVSNPTATPTSTTAYTLTETVTGSGCANSNPVTVTINRCPTAEILIGGTNVSGTHVKYCSGSLPSLTCSVGTSTGGPNTGDIIQFVWHNFALSPDPLIYPPHNPTFSSGSASDVLSSYGETTEIICDIYNLTGGGSTVVVVYLDNSTPAASVAANTTICSGSSYSIGASPLSGDTYSWTSSPSGFTSTNSNPSVNPTATTTYALTVTNTASGCTNTNSVTVSMPVALTLTAGTYPTPTPLSVNVTTTTSGNYSNIVLYSSSVTPNTLNSGNSWSYNATSDGYYWVTYTNVCSGLQVTTNTVKLAPACISYMPPNVTSPISTSTSLPSGINYFQIGTLVINSGVVWTIGSTSTLVMGENTEIEIQEGGELVLNGGTIKGCTQWRGIKVDGDGSSKTGAPPYISYPYHFGNLSVLSGTISDAITAVFSDQGGDLQIAGCNFINNDNHITIDAYSHPHGAHITSSKFGNLINSTLCTPLYASYKSTNYRMVYLEGDEGINIEDISGLPTTSANGFTAVQGTTSGLYGTGVLYGIEAYNLIGSSTSGDQINIIGNNGGAYANTFDGPFNTCIANTGTSGAFSKGMYIVQGQFGNSGVSGTTHPTNGIVFQDADQCYIGPSSTSSISNANDIENLTNGIEFLQNNTGASGCYINENQIEHNTYGIVIAPDAYPITPNSFGSPMNLDINTIEVTITCNRIGGNNIGIVGTGNILSQGGTSLSVSNEFQPSGFFVHNANADLLWNSAGSITYSYLSTSPLGSTPTTLLTGATINLNNSGPYTNSTGHYFSTNSGNAACTNYISLHPDQISSKEYLSSQDTVVGTDNPADILTPSVNDISVFPNPSSNIFNIKFPSSLNETWSMDVTDMLGKCMLEKNIQSNCTNTIDASVWASGVFQLRLVNQVGKVYQTRIEVQH